ncbi:glomulin-like isoform X2 [Dicentrarchus labrax]|uniref:glomulin-like isoform X2 n=1 Tax=Dicentrarchus labrax TaxID=13489 RepID=UPI0021F67492|nr:glomulin-like isoform X2 [Dicentrarchus labrax]
MMNEDQRDTPEGDLKPEDYQQFKSLGSTCLTECDSAQLLKFLQDEKNQGIVKSMGCVLMAPLVNEVVRKRKGLDHCQAAITYLTKTCSPDELLHSLLELIENIDPGAISETILALVPHLQTVLLRLEDRKSTYLGLALSALQKQLSRLPVPYSQQQEEDDEHGLCRCCNAMAAFTKPFVEEVKRKNGNYMTSSEDEELRTVLLKFCMRSLRDPLLEAELNRDRRSSLWLFATEIMVTLPAIQESLSELLFFNSLKKQTDNSQSKESRACLAYLLFVQLITIDSFPAVFSPVFVLQCNMEHINQLLSSKKESHLLKGLALYAKSLESVQDNSLPVSLLELKSFYSVPRNLRHLLTDCPMQHLRESGLQLFQLFINKLDAEAKHKFFRCMLKTSNHAGVESYIVKNIRNQVDFSMQPGNANKWFLGEEFLSLLGLVLCLPQGAETDLLNTMDRIMESLNLLRYLLLRDKELRSTTDVWEELCRIKDEYLKMLRVCIGISRVHYSAELKALREDQKLKAKEARDAARSTRLVKSITVKHESNMSPEVQHQVLQSALVTFDLMESLIVRIKEITEEKLRIPN